MEKLIDYWTKNANWLLEERHNLEKIYIERGTEFNNDEREAHKGMVKRNEERYKMIHETIISLSEVWIEQIREH